MALTTTQKAGVRRYLGYPDINRESHQGLESAMVALSAEGEVVVGDLLTQLAAIDAQLQTSWSRQKVVKAEDVILAGHDEILGLRHEGRRLAGQLAGTLGVEPRRDAFGSGNTAGQAGRG